MNDEKQNGICLASDISAKIAGSGSGNWSVSSSSSFSSVVPYLCRRSLSLSLSLSLSRSPSPAVLRRQMVIMALQMDRRQHQSSRCGSENNDHERALLALKQQSESQQVAARAAVHEAGWLASWPF